MFVSFRQMIVLTEDYEKWSPRIYFPTRLFTRALMTIYFFAFGIGLFWYNILASVSVFLLLAMLYYIFLFSSVWKIFDLSTIKFVLFLLISIPAAITIGVLVQKAFALIIDMIF